MTTVDVVNEYIAMLEANFKNIVIEKMVLESKLAVAERTITTLQTPKPESLEPVCGATCTCVGDYCAEAQVSSK